MANSLHLPSHLLSSSSRRTWIEICYGLDRDFRPRVVLLAEDVDRNVSQTVSHQCGCKSSSSRRTWIEIFQYLLIGSSHMSSSSRRTWIEMTSARKCCRSGRSSSSRRTWIEICAGISAVFRIASSSSRRTWIEISARTPPPWSSRVVLLAEDVDRNNAPLYDLTCKLRSSSSRRTWIEIVLSEEYARSQQRRPPRGGRG